MPGLPGMVFHLKESPGWVTGLHAGGQEEAEMYRSKTAGSPG